MLFSLFSVAGCNDNTCNSINSSNNGDTTDNQSDSNDGESTKEDSSSSNDSSNQFHFSTEWSFDQFDHWHNCLDEGLENVKKDKKEHDFVDGKCSVCDYRVETYNGYTFEIKGGSEKPHSSYKLVDVDKNITNAIIPSYYNGLPVEWLSCCFQNHTNLVSVTIPNTVRFISAYYLGTFSGCSSLKSIYIPDSVHYIGEKTFEGCSSLESVRLPNRLDSIQSETFSGCSSLKEINIPNSVSKIGDSAFFGCSSLTNIIIPNSVKEIGNQVFSGCDNLKYNEFGNGLYLGNEINKYVYLSSVKSKDIVTCNISENVQFVDCSIFKNLSALESISLPNFLKELPYDMFSNCVSLKDIELPQNLEVIRSNAFSNCSNLTNIIIPNSVSEIGSNAFLNCTSLKSFKIPFGVDIRGDAFSGCTELEYIFFPKSFRISGNYFLVGCDKLDYIFAENSAVSREYSSRYNDKVYCYSENAPTSEQLEKFSRYWHYVDNIPTPW